MKILITGVAGLLGSNLTQWLLANTKHTIVGIDDLSSGYESNLPRSIRFSFYAISVTNETKLTSLFLDYTFDICFHFACYAAEGRSNYIRRFIHYNNTVGTANVINACLYYNCKLIFTSSVAVYSGNEIYNEDTTPNPIDEYGLSKWTSERSIQIAGEQGLDWCIVRPRNVYGEHQSLFDEARNVMGIWMYQILNKQPMTIFGNGLNRRCFTYVGDILAPMYKAIEVSNEIINLGSPVPYPIKTANEILQGITEYTNVKYTEARHEVSEAICDTMKSEVLLNYEHKTYLKEGLTKMWEWAKTQPMRERQIPPPLEVNIKTHSSIK